MFQIRVHHALRLNIHIILWSMISSVHFSSNCSAVPCHDILRCTGIPVSHAMMAWDMNILQFTDESLGKVSKHVRWWRSACCGRRIRYVELQTQVTEATSAVCRALSLQQSHMSGSGFPTPQHWWWCHLMTVFKPPLVLPMWNSCHQSWLEVQLVPCWLDYNVVLSMVQPH